MTYLRLGLIFTALLVSVTVLEYLRVRRLISVGQELADNSRKYEQSAAKPSMRITFLGDSTAVGTGVLDPKLSLAGRLGQKFPRANIVNKAENGLQSDQLLKNVKLSPIEKQDLLIIHIGGNDIIRLKNLDQAAANIKETLGLLAPQNKQIAIFTTGDMGEVKLFPGPARPFYRHRSKYLRGQVKEISKSYPNVVYVDLFDQPESLRSVNGYAEDELHLNSNGYELWFKALQKRVTLTELQ